MHREFEAHFRRIFGAKYEKFFDAISSKPSTAIRLNKRKIEEVPFDGAAIPWTDDAYWLEKRPLFYADPLHFAGAYYVQDPSSMFFTAGIDFAQVHTALDLCAAPGGKSTHLLSKMSSNALLVSNELDIQRNKVLVENLNRWGHVNSVVTNAKTEAFTALEEVFDLVLLDAPCSGEGMFRKDEKSLDQWSPNLVLSCAALQQDLIEDAAQLVKPGGYLVYSTCTFEKAENEERVAQIVNSYDFEGVEIPFPQDVAIEKRTVDTSEGAFPAYHLFFHEIRGEGQFVCILKKKKAAVSTKKLRVKKNKLRALKPAETDRVHRFIELPDYLSLVEYDDMVYAIHAEHLELQTWLMASMPLWKLGVKVGQFAGKDFKPHHELALSEFADHYSNKIDVSYDTAISYLKREVFSVPDNTAKGWLLLTYKGRGLGWIKNLGNRVNNYLPKELTLRKDIKKAEF